MRVPKLFLPLPANQNIVVDDQAITSCFQILHNSVSLSTIPHAGKCLLGTGEIHVTVRNINLMNPFCLQFSRRVVTTYEDLAYLNKIIREKERNVLWDSPVKWFAMSSGTTEDKSKYIPVTRESLQHCHYRCGYHMLGLYANSYPDTEFFLGKTLVLGGSKQVNSIGNSTFTGDISAILMKNLPAIVKLARTPERIALLPDWEEKLKRLSEYAKGADIRALLGVPSWMLVLLKKISEETGKELPELWKNLEVFFTAE